ncbi:hypothetical protein BDW75DRAFT_217665 [Aspergillus navahoensis]
MFSSIRKKWGQILTVLGLQVSTPTVSSVPLLSSSVPSCPSSRVSLDIRANCSTGANELLQATMSSLRPSPVLERPLLSPSPLCRSSTPTSRLARL